MITLVAIMLIAVFGGCAACILLFPVIDFLVAVLIIVSIIKHVISRRKSKES